MHVTIFDAARDAAVTLLPYCALVYAESSYAFADGTYRAR